MNKTLSSDRSLLGDSLGLILSIPIEFTWTLSFIARALTTECSARAFHLGSGIRILDACRQIGGSSYLHMHLGYLLETGVFQCVPFYDSLTFSNQVAAMFVFNFWPYKVLQQICT
jgi:hypothetical protein